jgi:RNA polymerase sigma factor (sigma-70 family)
MSLQSKSGKRRELTQASFDLLLAALSEDRTKAAEKYEHIRQALITFFAFRGMENPYDLADETFNRVAERLSAGASIFTHNPANYFFGVARNVWREALAQPAVLEVLDEQLPQGKSLTPDPHDLLMQSAERRETERRLACLDKCLGKLTPQERELIVEYYQETGGSKIENRQRLAERYGISLKTLRNRTTLLRARLADCVNACSGQ